MHLLIVNKQFWCCWWRIYHLFLINS